MTPVPVLTAVTDARWEAQFVAEVGRADLGVTVVRRCVDLADLLAVAATGTARAVVVSGDLRLLDRESLARLAVQGLAVVGVVAAGDAPAHDRLRGLGVDVVLPSDGPATTVAAAVLQAVRDDRAPAGAPPTPPPATWQPDGGRLVAVWGPTGAPGRTTVATGLAAELAALGRSTLLVDADVYGAVVAQVLGLLDEAPGLVAAARLANLGHLDLAGLAELARGVGPRLRVLTGVARAARWPELRPTAVEAVLALSRGLVSDTVVDTGFCLEADEELAYDTAAPRRNGVTLSVLRAADVVVAVGAADPVGLQRLVRGLADLRAVVPDREPVVVVNRLRPRAVGPGDPRQQVTAALARYAGVHRVHTVPLDVAGHDGALAAGRTLAEAVPASPARLALAALAAELAGVAPQPRARTPWRRRRDSGRRQVAAQLLAGDRAHVDLVRPVGDA